MPYVLLVVEWLWRALQCPQAPQLLEMFLLYNLYRSFTSHYPQPFVGTIKHQPGLFTQINWLWWYFHLCVFISSLNSDVYCHRCATESWFGGKRQYLFWRTTRPQFKNTLTDFKYMDVPHCLCWMKPDAGTDAMPWAFTDQLRQIGRCPARVKIVQHLSSLYWIWADKSHARDLQAFEENMALPWMCRRRR